MNNRKSFHILNLEPEGYSNEAKSRLERLGRVVDGPMSREELLSVIADFDIVITRLGHRLDTAVLSVAKRLKVIVTATTGLNHIDVADAENRGIHVLSLQGERTFLDSIHATAEHTWGLILALTRCIPASYEHVKTGGWDRDPFRGHELHGRVLGIVGLGRLGQKVARYGVAFGMRVIACDINPEMGNFRDVEMMSLEEVAREADICSLHVNYVPENDGMIGRKELSWMKPHTCLVNTARGELVDEAALLDALEGRRMAGAALDVLRGENCESDASTALICYAKRNPNLLITPHIGGCTYESMAKTEVFMAKKLVDFLENIRSA